MLKIDTVGTAPTRDEEFDPDQVKKEHKVGLKLGREGVDPSLIIEGKRTRKQVSGRGKKIYYVR